MQRFLLAGFLICGTLMAATPPTDSGETRPARTENDAARQSEDEVAGETTSGPVDRIVAEVTPGPLEALVREVLARSPDIARARAQAEAAALRAPQVKALPDPMARLTVFALPPETRVGPQRLSASFSQRFPWFGKLKLREKAALLEAEAAWGRFEAVRLRQLTQARSLYHEVAFLDAFRDVLAEDYATLSQFEEIARARYASGFGLGQGVIKLQAEITKNKTRALEVATRRADLVARINRLRDRPEATPLAVEPAAELEAVALRLERLRKIAVASRPEVAAADAFIAAAAARIDLAQKEFRPDFTVGLTYTVVDNRQDTAGRTNPPEDDGQDALGLVGGINLPIWKEKLHAGVEEASRREVASQEGRRAVVAEIERALSDLLHRIPLTWERLRLFEDVLVTQAEESLHSAEAAYAAGNLNALDLLDAERVLLEVEIAAYRARADYAVALAELEGAAGAPLTDLREIVP